MEAKALVSVSAPLHRCCINNNVNLLATAAPLRLQKRNNSSVRVRWFARSSPAAAAAAARIYASSSSSSSSAPGPEQAQQKEKDLVFVAGATGKVGSRTVRELIKLGFRVRAAVRSAERASSLVKSVEQLNPDATAKLEVVECDLEKQPEAGIVAAIGNAALVVCSIGASEKEILDVTGPYRIDYMATNNLVQAAAAAKVEHFILVTSLGTSKIGFPASLLNLFWGVLCWKRRAEEALIASGVAYTIVRPGGMERPTDAFKETHNLVLAPQDTYVGGLVSNLQVAELIGCICNCMPNNRKAAYCKVVEVVAETTAPLLPMEDLLSRIPSDPGREPPDEIDAPIITGEAPAPAPAPSPAAAARAEQPLSPYTAYEGLKPPSSPSPSPAPTTTRSNSTTRTSDHDDDDSPSPKQDKIIVQSPSWPLSPYTAFVDLKPPTSPSPSPPPTPAASDPDATSTNTTAAADASSPLMDSNANGTPLTTTHPLRPLSPYTRYEELKPPTSPTPSAPEL